MIDDSESSEESLAKYAYDREVEHRFCVLTCSASPHGSPRSVAIRWPHFAVARIVGEIPKVIAVATVHFSRVFWIAARELDIDFDRNEWTKHLHLARHGKPTPEVG